MRLALFLVLAIVVVMSVTEAADSEGVESLESDDALIMRGNFFCFLSFFLFVHQAISSVTSFVPSGSFRPDCNPHL